MGGSGEHALQGGKTFADKSGDLAEGPLVDRVAFPLMSGVGPLGLALGSLGAPWAGYVARLRELRDLSWRLMGEQQRLARLLAR